MLSLKKFIINDYLKIIKNRKINKKKKRWIIELNKKENFYLKNKRFLITKKILKLNKIFNIWKKDTILKKDKIFLYNSKKI